MSRHSCLQLRGSHYARHLRPAAYGNETLRKHVVPRFLLQFKKFPKRTVRLFFICVDVAGLDSFEGWHCILGRQFMSLRPQLQAECHHSWTILHKGDERITFSYLFQSMGARPKVMIHSVINRTNGTTLRVIPRNRILLRLSGT